MNRRIVLGGKTYIATRRYRTESAARRQAKADGAKWTHIPGEGFFVLCPADPYTGLPARKGGAA